jgi:hypothetical protein
MLKEFSISLKTTEQVAFLIFLNIVGRKKNKITACLPRMV